MILIETNLKNEESIKEVLKREGISYREEKTYMTPYLEEEAEGVLDYCLDTYDIELSDEDRESIIKTVKYLSLKNDYMFDEIYDFMKERITEILEEKGLIE